MIEHCVCKDGNPKPVFFMTSLTGLGARQTELLFPKSKKMLDVIPTAIGLKRLPARDLLSPLSRNHQPKRPFVNWAPFFIGYNNPHYIKRMQMRFEIPWPLCK
jgi:hypothetical protein